MTEIATRCPKCGRDLRVGRSLIGQPVRCPVCQAVHTVVAAEHESRETSEEMWLLRTPEGVTYGPVPLSTLETWVAAGRVDETCQVAQSGSPEWQNAADRFPQLAPEVSTAVSSILWNRQAPTPTDQAVEPAPFSTYTQSDHRGGVILALGILAWAIGCPLFGFLAWVMGSHDLHEMQQGKMDAEGRNLTAAGRWIGMLHSIVTVIVILVGMTAALVWQLI